MKFIQTPVKGMQDFLPEDMALRQHVLGLIRETYGRYGFTEIETPVMEHIENLTGKNGGENEKLIFKVEKRGRELEKALGKVRGSEDMPSDAAGTEIVDSALRYDLTVPVLQLPQERASHPVQSTADRQRVPCGPSPEGSLPPVYTVRHRYYRR